MSSIIRLMKFRLNKATFDKDLQFSKKKQPVMIILVPTYIN